MRDRERPFRYYDHIAERFVTDYPRTYWTSNGTGGSQLPPITNPEWMQFAILYQNNLTRLDQVGPTTILLDPYANPFENPFGINPFIGEMKFIVVRRDTTASLSWEPYPFTQFPEGTDWAIGPINKYGNFGNQVQGEEDVMVNINNNSVNWEFDTVTIPQYPNYVINSIALPNQSVSAYFSFNDADTNQIGLTLTATGQMRALNPENPEIENPIYDVTLTRDIILFLPETNVQISTGIAPEIIVAGIVVTGLTAAWAVNGNQPVNLTGTIEMPRYPQDTAFINQQITVPGGAGPLFSTTPSITLATATGALVGTIPAPVVNGLDLIFTIPIRPYEVGEPGYTGANPVVVLNYSDVSAGVPHNYPINWTPTMIASSVQQDLPRTCINDVSKAGEVTSVSTFPLNINASLLSWEPRTDAGIVTIGTGTGVRLIKDTQNFKVFVPYFFSSLETDDVIITFKSTSFKTISNIPLTGSPQTSFFNICGTTSSSGQFNWQINTGPNGTQSINLTSLVPNIRANHTGIQWIELNLTIPDRLPGPDYRSVELQQLETRLPLNWSYVSKTMADPSISWKTDIPTLSGTDLVLNSTEYLMYINLTQEAPFTYGSSITFTTTNGCATNSDYLFGDNPNITNVWDERRGSGGSVYHRIAERKAHWTGATNQLRLAVRQGTVAPTAGVIHRIRYLAKTA